MEINSPFLGEFVAMASESAVPMELEEVQGLARLREFAAKVWPEVVMFTEEDPMTMNGVKPVVHALKPVRRWLQHCAKHLRHIEERAMWQDVLGHEFMRRFAQLIEGFSPPPRGDWGLLLRKAEDMGTRGLRQLIKLYYDPTEDFKTFLERAISVVRLFIEEAFRRCLSSEASGMRKRALCGLMVTMRNFEAEMIPKKHVASLGIFYSFNKLAVRRMAVRVHSVWTCPSYEAAMTSEMRVELVSLMIARPWPSLFAMTHAEVRALIEHNNDELLEGEAVPGKDSVSVFDDLFNA